MSRETLRRAAAAALVLTLTALVVADEYVDRANRLYASIRADQRSDLVILPKIAAMDPFPEGLPEFGRLHPDAEEWAEAESWAMAEPQRAVLDALREVTAETDYRRAMAFGQPYGIDGVPTELVEAGLYTEIRFNDEKLLHAAEFKYLENMLPFMRLVGIEANRLAAEGQAIDAMNLLVDFVFFGRQIADREFAYEMIMGIAMMGSGMEAMRRIVYEDLHADRAVSADLTGLMDVIDRILETDRQGRRGFIGVERLSFPRADRIAAEQLGARVLDDNSAREGDFAAVLSRLQTQDQPLKLFGQEATWRSLARTQAGRRGDDGFDRMVNLVFGDWTSRWSLEQRNPFDARMYRPSDFVQRVTPIRHAILAEATGDLGILFDARRELRAEAIGTRTALGVVGYYLQQGRYPPSLTSIRPRWVPSIEADPFNPNRDGGRVPPMQYQIPGQGGMSDPHRMRIGQTQVGIGSRDFLLWSYGADEENNRARRVYSMLFPGHGDYLIWPPASALVE